MKNKMTKQEAIENHRKLWNWLAQTTNDYNKLINDAIKANSLLKLNLENEGIIVDNIHHI